MNSFTFYDNQRVETRERRDESWNIPDVWLESYDYDKGLKMYKINT